jgi:transcriptional regulator GlxA family with amidase domain
MGSQHGQRYRQIVCRIEELLQNDRGEQLHVDDLCRAAAVSERTLRNAFRKVHGVSPYRYLRGFRMTQARQALLSAGSRHGTVTEVAMQFGFLELGRFSVDYRSAFGECPSATLRRAMERELSGEITGAPQIGYRPAPFAIEAMEPSQHKHAAVRHAA